MHAPRRWAVLALVATCWLLPASSAHATTIVGAVQTNAHEGQIGVGWRTDQAATTEVAWDTQPRGSWAAYANSWSYAGKDSAAHGHTFTVAQPGITYFVRVRSEGIDGLTVESPELQVTVAAHFLDRPTGRYVPNGQVLDMEAVGSTMYAVGAFTEFRPAATGAGKFDATSGALDTSFPQFERDTYHSAAATQVTDVEPDGEGGWYVVGSFDRVAGWNRNNAVHVLADGGIDPFWAPRIGNWAMFPRDIELVGGVLYVVGEFTDVEGGTVRNRAAAFDAETGALLPWNPDLNSTVNSIDVIGSTAYLGGAFTQAAGSTPRNRAASVNLTDGALNPWNPNLNAEARVVRASGSAVFLGGDFTTVGGVSRNRLAAVDPATGAVTGWAGPSITGGPLPRVYALELDGTRLFVGGYFTTVGASSRNSLASVDATTGSIDSWNPNVTGSIADIAVNGASVYVAGSFATIGGQSRSGGAVVDAGSGAVGAFDPRARSSYDGPTLSTIAAGPGGVVAGGVLQSAGTPLMRDRAAAFNMSTGEPTVWDPDLDANAGAIEIVGSTAFIGGNFATVNNGAAARGRLASFNLTTGTVTSWDPGPNAYVGDLDSAGGRLYAVGGFSTVNPASTSRVGAAAWNIGTGALEAWNPRPSAEVHAVEATPSTTFISGCFESVNSGAASRTYIAEVDSVTGTATSWVPSVSTGAYNCIHEFGLTNTTVHYAGTDDEGWCIQGTLSRSSGAQLAWFPSFDCRSGEGLFFSGSSSTIHVFGRFNWVWFMSSGYGRQRAAKFDVVAQTIDPWYPVATTPMTGPVSAVRDIGNKVLIAGMNYNFHDPWIFLVSDATRSAPQVDASSHVPGAWTTDNTIDVDLSGTSDHDEGVYGWSYEWSTSASTVPDAIVDDLGASMSASSGALPDSATHYLHARFVDGEGSWSETIHHGPLRIDSGGPSNPTLTVAAPHAVGGFSTDETIEVGVAGSADPGSGIDGFSYEWSTSATTVPDLVKDAEESLATITSPTLAHGQHYLHVRTVDNLGYWSAPVHVGPVGVDTTVPSNPTLTVVAPHAVSGFSADQTIEVGVAGASDADAGVDGFSYEWSTSAVTVPDTVKDGEESLATITSASLAGGQHYLHVRTRDNAGNWSATVRIGPIGIDTTAPTNPTLTVVAPHAVGGFSNDVTVEVGVAGASDADAGVDGFSWEWSTSAVTVPDAVKDGEQSLVTITSPTLADGQHYLHVRTRDDVGNWSATVRVGPIGIDTVALPNPTVTIVAPHVVGAWSSDQTIEATVSGVAAGVDGFSYEWSTSAIAAPDLVKDDEESLATITSPTLVDGQHYLHLRTRDDLGNWSAPVHVGPVGVDTTAPSNPTLTVVAPHTVGGWAADQTIEVGVAGASDAGAGVDGFSYEWSTSASIVPDAGKDDEETLSTVNSGPRLDGQHYLHVRTLDVAGNWSAAAHLGPIGIDTTAPTAQLVGAASGSSLVWQIVATDGGSGVDPVGYEYPGFVRWQSSPVMSLPNIAPGTTIAVSARVRDRAGNTTGMPLLSVQAPDTVPPAGVLSTGDSGTNDGALTVSGQHLDFTLTDIGLGVDYAEATLGGEPVRIVDGRLDITGLVDGTHDISVRVVDRAGNETTFVVEVQVDRTAPTPIAETMYRFGSRAVVEYSDVAPGRRGARGRTASGTVIVRGLRCGRNVRTVRMADRSGNARTSRVVIHRVASLAHPKLNTGCSVAPRPGTTVADWRAAYGLSRAPHGAGGASSRHVELVKAIQSRLHILGYRNVRVSGRLDAATLRATRDFQRRSRIAAVGVPGPRTLRALDQALLGLDR